MAGWETRYSDNPVPPYRIFGKGGKDVGGMMSWASMGQNEPTKEMGHIHTMGVDAATKSVVAGCGTLFRLP